MSEVGNLQVKLGLKMDEFTQGMKNVEAQITQTEQKFSGFKKVGDTLTTVGKGMTAGITLPVVGIGAAAIKSAADFESMGNIFGAVSGATSEQMAQMSDLAIALGNDISLPGTSATDAAEAMTELAKAGLSIDDTFSAVKATLQLSAAAQIGNAEAATIVGQALNAFNLQGDQAITVADLLSNSANASAGEITDMAQALQAGASVAAMSGQSIGDFTTAISLMANAGITGSDAGTSLKSMFMALMSPTAEASKLMRDLGVNVYDASGKMLPMPQLVEQFSSKLGGMTEEQRNAALATIFGSDAVRAANTVLMGGTEQWGKMSDAVNKGGGAAELAGAKMQGTSGAFEALKSTIETLAIKIGELLLPVITPLVEKLTSLVDWFGRLPKGVQEAIVVIAGLAAVIGPILLIIGPLISSFSSIAAVIPIVGAAFGALTGPVGIAIAAIAAVVAIGVLLYTKWDEISAWLTKTWNTIKETAVSVWDSIASFFVGIWDSIKSTATSVWDSIKGFLVGLWNDIKSIASSVWDGIKTVILTPINILKDLLTGNWEGINNTASTLWNNLKSTASSIWEGIKEVISIPVNALKDFLSTTWGSIKDAASTVWESIKSIASTVWDGIKSVISAPINAVKDFLSNTWNAIKGDTSNVWDSLKNIASSTWESMKSVILSPMEALHGLLSNVWNSISSAASSAWNGLKSAASNIFNQVKEAIIAPFRNIHIPLPHFSFSIAHTSIAGISIPYPKVSVSWYKRGGIFDAPNIIGVGEAGPEAVLPIDRLGAILADTMRRMNIDTSAKYGATDRYASSYVSLLERIARAVETGHGDVIIHADTAAGGEAAAGAFLRRLSASGVRV